MSARRLHLAARAAGRLAAQGFTSRELMKSEVWSQYVGAAKRWLHEGSVEGHLPQHVDYIRKIASTLRNR